MNVLVWAREASQQRARTDGYAVAARREDFYEQSDVVSLHMRLVPGTRGIVTAADLQPHEAVGADRQHEPRGTHRTRRAGRRPSVGTARHGRRGCLRNGTAARRHDPLLTLPNVVCTPHIGYVTRDKSDLQFSDVFDQILAYASRTADNVVNPAVGLSNDLHKPLEPLNLWNPWNLRNPLWR